MKVLNDIEKKLNKVKEGNSFFDGITIGKSDSYNISYSFNMDIYEYSFNFFEIIKNSFEFSKKLLKEKDNFGFEDSSIYTNRFDKVKDILSLDDICKFTFNQYAKKRVEMVKNHFIKEYENTEDIKESINSFIETISSKFKSLDINKKGRTISLSGNDFNITMNIEDNYCNIIENNNKYQINIDNPFDAIEHMFNKFTENTINKSLLSQDTPKNKIKNSKKNKLH